MMAGQAMLEAQRAHGFDHCHQGFEVSEQRNLGWIKNFQALDLLKGSLKFFEIIRDMFVRDAKSKNACKCTGTKQHKIKIN